MIELPWPSNKMSPNARTHPIALRRLQVKHKTWAHAATLEVRPDVPASGDIRIIVTAYPPGRYHYDRDNFVARCKPYFDGVALGLGLDDVRFDPRVQWGEPVKNGRVVITVGEGG